MSGKQIFGLINPEDMSESSLDQGKNELFKIERSSKNAKNSQSKNE